MALATLFPLSVYMMLALASCILMYAEGTAFPAFFTIPLAFLAYLFSERRSVLVLSGWLANILGLVALMVAAQEFFASLEGRLLSGAHLLVYLVWLVIFLPKTRQHYWWTIALSVLQVAVSAVLTRELGYGLLLVLFCLVTIWTVSLFTVFLAYRDEQEDEQLEQENSEAGMSRRLNPHHIEISSGRVLFGLPSRSIGGVEYDPHAKWVGIRFAGRAMGITMGCLIIGMTFFLCIPRLWSDINPFEDKALGPTITGFSQKVRLGQMGTILESRQLAMTVTLYEGNSNQIVPMESFLQEFGMSEPYFRGNVMDHYSHGDWNTKITDMPATLDYEVSRPEMYYRQHIELEPLGTQHLFLMHPFSSINIRTPRDDVILAQVHFIVMRKRKRNSSAPMVYDVYTRRRTPRPIDDRPRYYDKNSRRPSRNELNELFLQFPETDLSRVRELTMNVANLQNADLPVRSENRQAVAEKVVSHLRDSGEYKYSLKSEVLDPSIDPLEDFLFNRKSGHCEYYASSLALMLRSVGIPTRLINGYKGGIPDETAGTLEVQQRHAHAWTEVYFSGRWNLMDATPAAEREEIVAAAGNSNLSWNELKERVKNLWSRYVVSMNYSYQRRNFYRFTAEELKAFWSSIGTSVRQWGRQIVEFIKHPERWFSLRGGITAFSLLTLLTGIGFICRWIFRKLRRWLARSQRDRSRRRQVEFYERFLRLCEQQRLVKAPAQTPREFSQQVADAWSQLLAEHGWHGLPASLVDQFYAIRFGEELLPPSDERELLGTLQKLEQVVQARSNGKTRAASA